MPQQFNQPSCPCVLVVGMETHEPGRDPEVAEEVPGPARILGGHEGDFPKNAQGAEGDVVEVADRRGDDEQRTGHILL